MNNFPYTMTFHPNTGFNLSNFSSFPSQQEKAYPSSPNYYLGISSEDGFCNPRSSKVGKKKAGATPRKQISHKMIERQRRKDMSYLYSELRSLLPQETMRGKRSVTEQLAETFNYIHYLQLQIIDLTKEREKNKVVGDFSNGIETSKAVQLQESDEGFPSVKIKSFGSAAFQVYINSIQNQIALSDALMVLEECRFEVVTAASFAINGKVFHTINAKVTDHSNSNLETLYAKLQRLIRTEDREN